MKNVDDDSIDWDIKVENGKFAGMEGRIIARRRYFAIRYIHVWLLALGLSFAMAGGAFVSGYFLFSYSLMCF